MPHSYPLFPEKLPDTAKLCSGQYAAAFARTPEELDEVQRLRFQVFNLELGEGLEESFATRRDADPFDDQCHHLIIRDRNTGELVGTYRMQDKAMADAGKGFYSDAEFHLEQLPQGVLEQALELGRACIHEDHRSGRVLFLLWRGLVCYLLVNRLRYFFGCCSAASQDPADGWALFTRLRRAGHLAPGEPVPAKAAYVCENVAPTEEQVADIEIPRLMRLYLDYCAKMCSEPALDREFKTIDFLALFDLEDLPPKLLRVFSKDIA